jgi:hypothetical protein
MINKRRFLFAASTPALNAGLVIPRVPPVEPGYPHNAMPVTPWMIRIADRSARVAKHVTQRLPGVIPESVAEE